MWPRPSSGLGGLETDGQGPGAAIRGAPILKTENPAAGSQPEGHAPIWTTADARGATANDALGVAMVRTLPASRAACLRGRGHPVGAERLKRQTARWRTLHELRRERCNAAAARLGWQSYRLLSVSSLTKRPRR